MARSAQRARYEAQLAKGARALCVASQIAEEMNDPGAEAELSMCAAWLRVLLDKSFKGQKVPVVTTSEQLDFEIPF